ncbi:MAG: efflux RND transporter periplasmic adaptor subunit [Gammaproteobacteria bacterium]|nr:efflux RND transporter periplasmic adaptor subunit [Gammaproteobacteria bacterium]
MNKQVSTTVLIGVVAVALGLAGGYWLARQQTGSTVMGHAVEQTMAPAEEAREPLFYRNPMDPTITSPVPAKDEMGMDYIPVYADSESSGPAGTVRIDPVTVQSIGVRTASAERRIMARTIHTLGRVEYDEQRIVRLHPKVEGWIEELYTETTGEQIPADHILLNIYSPQLVVSQQEYLLALRNLETLQASPFPDVERGARDLVDSALARLRLLDVPEHQIEELDRTRAVQEQLHIHSPSAGIVINVGVREGQYVTPQTELFTVADLSRVWVLVDVFEDELPWVSVGDHAELRVTAVPGRVFEGELTYIYPYAETQTRTVKARLEFDNPGLELKPNMFADVTLHASAQVDAVAVPSEAVVRSGVREQIFVVRGPGTFEPREVQVGVSSEGWTHVISGVDAGEEVVVSAQFLIDSESKLREAAAKMLEASSNEEMGDMEGMGSMGEMNDD